MQNTVKFLRHIIVAGVFLTCAGSDSLAFDARFQITANETTEKAVTSASLVFAIQQKETASTQEILAAARADYRNILQALYAGGYYSGRIRITVDGREVANISPLENLPHVDQVKISVDAGQQFVFGQVKISPLTNETTLPKGFREGVAAKSKMLGNTTRTVIDAWRDQGFAKARVADQKIVADHRSATLDARFTINPGPRATFGEFVLTGNKAVREKRIREIAGFPEGRVFSPAALDTVATRLRRTGAFRSVSLSEADNLHSNDTLDIAAHFVEAKPRRFGIGAELSSPEGGRLSGFWLHRNLLGGAERLRFDGEVAGLFGTTGLDYSLAGRFERPATFGPDISLFITGEIAELDEPDYFSRQVQLSLGLSAILSDQLVADASVGYRYSDVTDDFGDRSFTHLVVPLSATYDRRNSGINPTGGYYAQVSAMPYLGLNGSANGAQLTGDMRGYWGIGEAGKIILAGRLQFGNILGSSLAQTPPDLLFYSGGGGSVRGQPYQSLDVDLGGGNSSGGRSILGISTEIRTLVFRKTSVVGFFDAGFVGADGFSTDNGAWHSGAGIGLRYETGIGPIRFDIAAPVSGDTGEGVQFYVGIGQAF